MWFDTSVLYQIYPLGLCGAPLYNDGVETPRLRKLTDWIPHILETGADTVLLNPVMDSDRSGYDTRDYTRVDPRLGTNEDLHAVCRAFHQAGLRVLFDGVFNHVGRGFWAFRDVQERKWDSPYKDWFYLNFDGNTEWNDGFWYEGWEGCMDLVKLNLGNSAVVEHQLEAVRSWVQDYDIDGLRLDVAYSLAPEFLRTLRRFTEELKPEFVLLGETLHGDYRRWMNPEMCHSVTNYECYKGIWSALNSGNLFEIAHSLGRQFGPEEWTLYKGAHLLNFLDNHDVPRIATKLNDRQHLIPAWGLLFGMPGVPAIYYGSEWGLEGEKRNLDEELRPALDAPCRNGLTAFISRAAAIRAGSEALCFGGYRNVLIQPRQLIFARETERERVLVAINADSNPCRVHFDAGCSQARELLSDTMQTFEGGCELPPYSVQYWRAE